MDIGNIVLHIFGGFVFFGFGWVYFEDERADIRIGKGRGLFTAKFRGNIAKAVGITFMFGSFLFMLPAILSIFHTFDDDSFLFMLPFIGVTSLIFGVVVALVFHIAISAGDKLKTLRDDSQN